MNHKSEVIDFLDIDHRAEVIEFYVQHIRITKPAVSCLKFKNDVSSSSSSIGLL